MNPPSQLVAVMSYEAVVTVRNLERVAFLFPVL